VRILCTIPLMMFADTLEQEIEIIMEPTARSLDFRCVPLRSLPSLMAHRRVPSGKLPRAVLPKIVLHLTTPQPEVMYCFCLEQNATLILYAATQPSLTTEYTPHERGGLSTSPRTPHQTHPASISPVQSSYPNQPQPREGSAEDSPDPSTLPAVLAPPSHPTIDLAATGMFDGRSILEVDLAAMAEKPWRRPGSDISDWFNYGFDELSWEVYCYRRRDLGDLGAVLKTNVVVRPLSTSHC
jgi:pre-mRNA 3'-end-processing factor FIP1